MIALRLYAPGRLALERAEEPVAGPAEVVLRVTHCAVCRTDAKMWRMGHRDLNLPRIPGHEICGEGPDGRRYVVWPGIACGRCGACRSGAENLCPEMRIVGFHRDGGFAERVAVPRAGLLAAPPELPGTVACLAEPLACAVNGLDQAGVRTGERVLIQGAGPLGLLIGLAARRRGALPAIREIRSDRLSETREFRERAGIAADDGDGADFDAVLNAAPDGGAFSQGLARLRPGGRFCLFSGLTVGSPPSLADLNRIHYRQLTVTGAYGCTRDGMRKALQILAECPNQAAFLVEAEIGLADVPDLLPTILEGRGLRRVIRPGRPAPLLFSPGGHGMASESQLRDFGRQICAVAAGTPLTREQAREAYRRIIQNEQPELQQGAFLMAHIARGPTVEELGGAWDALDRYDTAKIDAADVAGPVCDIVGTGSDPIKTVNCSTPASVIAAACGLPVAKKGARLVTGVSGASDVLEILGLDLNAPLESAEACLKTHGLCYLPGEAFLRSGWARLIRSMRFTSVFNIIGPLTRPCVETRVMVVGGYSPDICDRLIHVLREIGMPAAAAPFGRVTGLPPEEGMDEFSPCGPTRVTELRDGRIETYEVTPEDFGVRTLPLDRVASSRTAHENARRMELTLQGRHDTPEADFFCMNAGALMRLAGRADTYAAGTELARQALAQGLAWEKFRGLLDFQGA